MAAEIYELRDMKLDFPIKSVAITGLEITQSANSHGRMKISFIADKYVTVKDIMTMSEGAISLKCNNKVIFSGICADVQLDNMENYSELTIVADTTSIQLDRVKRNRCFQDAGKKLSDIINEVLKGTKATLSVSPDETVPEIVFQNKETDFAFLKRILNKYKMNLYVSRNDKNITMTAGKKYFQTRNMDDKYSIHGQSKDILFFARYKAKVDNKAVAYSVNQDKYVIDDIEWQAGDKVSGSPDRYVSDILISGEHGVVSNTVFLRSVDGNVPRSETVCNSLPACVEATVLDIKENNIQVEYIMKDIANTQDKAKAMWIPYEHDMSNYAYIMPEKNDRVFVYFTEAGEPVARGGRRLSSDSDKDKKVFEKNKKEFLPSTKMLTNHNKMMRFTPKAMEFVSDKKNYGKGSMVQFDAEKGIRIFSDKSVTINAEKTIRMQSSSSILTEVDAIASFTAKEKAGEGILIAGAGAPPVDMMDDIKTGIGIMAPSVFNSGKQDEFTAGTDAVKYIKENLPGGKSPDSDKPKKDSYSYPKDVYANVLAEGKVVIKVGSSLLKAESGKVTAKASTVYQLGLIPKATGGSGSSLGIIENDDFDSNKVINVPKMKRNKKSLGKAGSITSGSGGSVQKPKAKSVEDMKRKALEFKTVRKNKIEWKLSFDALSGI